MALGNTWYHMVPGNRRWYCDIKLKWRMSPLICSTVELTIFVRCKLVLLLLNSCKCLLNEFALGFCKTMHAQRCYASFIWSAAISLTREYLNEHWNIGFYWNTAFVYVWVIWFQTDLIVYVTIAHWVEQMHIKDGGGGIEFLWGVIICVLNKPVALFCMVRKKYDEAMC